VCALCLVGFGVERHFFLVVDDPVLLFPPVYTMYFYNLYQIDLLRASPRQDKGRAVRNKFGRVGNSRRIDRLTT
jgi:hypothetical protein